MPLVGWFILGGVGVLIAIIVLCDDDVDVTQEEEPQETSSFYDCSACKDGTLPSYSEQICPECGRQLDSHMNS